MFSWMQAVAYRIRYLYFRRLMNLNRANYAEQLVADRGKKSPHHLLHLIFGGFFGGLNCRNHLGLENACSSNI